MESLLFIGSLREFKTGNYVCDHYCFKGSSCCLALAVPQMNTALGSRAFFIAAPGSWSTLLVICHTNESLAFLSSAAFLPHEIDLGIDSPFLNVVDVA